MSNPHVHVRLLTPNDRDAIVALNRFLGVPKYDDEHMYGIFIDDALIGMCRLDVVSTKPIPELDGRPEYTKDSLLLSDVFIKGEYRRQKYGTQLILTAIRRSNSSAPIFCHPVDVVARQFYYSLGFRWFSINFDIYRNRAFFPIESHLKYAEKFGNKAQACPHCGAAPTRRTFTFFDKPCTVSCSCGFYQAAETTEQALKLWNEATDTTLPTPLRRVDAFPTRRIIDTTTHTNSVCQWCECCKEKYPNGIPDTCKECGYLNERNQPYEVETPVYEDGGMEDE